MYVVTAGMTFAPFQALMNDFGFSEYLLLTGMALLALFALYIKVYKRNSSVNETDAWCADKEFQPFTTDLFLAWEKESGTAGWAIPDYMKTSLVLGADIEKQLASLSEEQIERFHRMKEDFVSLLNAFVRLDETDRNSMEDHLMASCTLLTKNLNEMNEQLLNA